MASARARVAAALAASVPNPAGLEAEHERSGSIAVVDWLGVGAFVAGRDGEVIFANAAHEREPPADGSNRADRRNGRQWQLWVRLGCSLRSSRAPASPQ